MENVKGCCVDSDVLIDYLRGRKDAREFLLEVSTRTPLFISAISIAEIYGGEETLDLKKQEQIEKFLQNFGVIEINRFVAHRAGELRRDFHLPFADALIAAGAQMNGLPLVTRNIKHFQNVKALELICPY